MSYAILTLAGDPNNPKFATLYVGGPVFTECVALPAGTQLMVVPTAAEKARVLSLAHGYADAKLVRYGNFGGNRKLPSPDDAWLTFTAALENLWGPQ